MLKPTSGKIQILGGTPDDKRIRSRIGFLPEESYLYPFLTGQETMRFFCRIFGLGRREAIERSRLLLHQLGIADAAGRKIKEYSKGMQRRLGLSIALINNPDLLLLDEPTSGLDPIGSHEIKSLLRQLKDQGKTILISSHLLPELQSLCDRIGILFQGHLLREGTVREVLERKDTRCCQVSGLGDAAHGELAAWIQAQGGRLEKDEPALQNLEDVFLQEIVTFKGKSR